MPPTLRNLCLLVSASLSGIPLVLAQPSPPPGPPPAAQAPVPFGAPIPGLSAAEVAAFFRGQATFQEVDTVPTGLGPRFNLDSCAGCHAHPAVGGSSPAVNPQVTRPLQLGALNTVPPFIQANGPVRAVRFVLQPDGTPDGGVHDLFVITGRSDAPATCAIQQPSFTPASNLAFRIPTPLFGMGLIEAISDATLTANLAATAAQRQALGIGGHFNTNANDGTITRFGWKAQNKSMLMFAGEAYNVEIGVTNDLFPQERETNPGCATNATPEDTTDFAANTASDIENFAVFMRFLAPPPPPAPGPPSPSVQRGSGVFNSLGCALCHTPVLQTSLASTAALSAQNVVLYSDLALHNMGSGLADGISQGNAAGAEFRSAPLWGLGSRLFYLHDGRSQDLLDTIQLHDSAGSEAHGVIAKFNALPAGAQQDLLNFLHSL
jgi:CxxC motif-containing protein (DUF1111 family)